MFRAVLPLALALAGACTPKIGDDCTISTDCSPQGDRLCDTTQPGGYCTIFNCEPDTCPEEAQCVAFYPTIDPACEEETTQWSRFERTFCMLGCESDDDCRGGYACIAPEERQAEIVDQTSTEYSKVCVVTDASSYEVVPGSELCGAP